MISLLRRWVKHMNKFWIVLSHTYLSRLLTKAFIISTVITLLFIIGIANIGTIMDVILGEDGKKEVAVIDETNGLFTALQTAVTEVEDEILLTNYADTEEAGKIAVQEEELDALLVLSLDENELDRKSVV